MNICAIDLFCGIGGLTHGLIQSGINVKAGVDNDGSCKSAYERNNKGAIFISSDIKKINADRLNEHYKSADVKVLVGCAPCQPFSAHRNKSKKGNDDFSLLLEVSRLVSKCQPHIVSVENVPGLIHQDVYLKFTEHLKKLGFKITEQIVFCPEYGIPQIRKRLVLLASRFGVIEIVPPPYPKKEMWESVSTVEKFLKGLPRLRAGGVCRHDPYHVTSKLSDINLARIKQSIPGGNWRDWDKNLVPPCRTRSVYYSPYGRMEWGKPAPTITTQFFGYSHGRFGHPTQNRAISLREGGLLQTFPKSYKFHDKQDNLAISTTARHIGNAVPVKLARHIGKTIQRHVNEFAK